MMHDLHGRVAVITGASSGIGSATARALVAAGARVVVGARRSDRLEALTAELGESARAVVSDVRNPDDMRRLADAAVESFGRLDILVANAGIGMYGGILDHTDAELAEMMDTNVAGTVWAVRAALPHLRASDAADIIIISSVAGLRAAGDEAVYGATKHAQIGLAGALDRELHHDGIRISAICPGGTATEFAIGRGRTEGDPALARMMTADDVAAAVRAALTQPRSMRTLIHSMRGITEDD
jgi:NADP-dependent 3-hydroxy acid dehydrogenase YdfG